MDVHNISHFCLFYFLVTFMPVILGDAFVRGWWYDIVTRLTADENCYKIVI